MSKRAREADEDNKSEQPLTKEARKDDNSGAAHVPDPLSPPPRTSIKFFNNAYNSLLADKMVSIAVVGAKGCGKSAFLNTLLNKGKADSWPLHSALGAFGVTMNFIFIRYAKGNFRAFHNGSELFSVEDIDLVLPALKNHRGIKGDISLVGPFPGLPENLEVIDCPGWGDASLFEFHRILYRTDAIAVVTPRLATRDQLAQALTLASGARQESPLVFNVHFGQAASGYDLLDWQMKVELPTTLSVAREGTDAWSLYQTITEYRQRGISERGRFLRSRYQALRKMGRYRSAERQKPKLVEESVLLALRSKLTFLNWSRSESDWPLSWPVKPLGEELTSTLDPVGVLLRFYFSLLGQSRVLLQELFDKTVKEFGLREVDLLQGWARFWDYHFLDDIKEGAEEVSKVWLHERNATDKNWITIQSALLPVKQAIRENMEKVLVGLIEQLDLVLLVNDIDE